MGKIKSFIQDELVAVSVGILVICSIVALIFSSILRSDIPLDFSSDSITEESLWLGFS